MQICKPMSLGFSSRAIEYRKRYGLCVTHYLYVPLVQGPRGRLWGEQSMWNFVGREMAQPLLDEGVAKLTPEFLVHGHAYPDPTELTGCAVRVRLADREKTLLAFGDRWWDGDRPRALSAGAPEKIGLDWSNAYGGADFAPNPAGKGRAAVGGVRPLPNLELPGSRVLSPQSEVMPAGYGPLDSVHPQRLAFRGSYGADYLKAHAPGFPPDLDWKHFNMAPSDQWLDAPLRGDEPYALDNLHPTQRRIEGQLPGLRVRTFVNYAQGEAGGHKLREVPMRLTTVWFFPHAERMAMVFHGMAECAEDDGSDITHLLAAVERLGEPKSDEHYIDVLARRSDPKHGSLEALSDADLLPPDIDTADPEAEQAEQAFAMEGLQGQAQRRRAEMDLAIGREALEAQGKDSQALVLPPLEKKRSMAELPAYLKARQKEAEASRWAAIEEMADQLQRVLDMEDAGQIDMAKLAHRGPPDYNAEAHLAKLDAQRAAGLVFDQRAVAQKLAQRESVERLGYLQAAHLQPPAYPLQGEVAKRGRALVQWMLAKGLRSFPGIDLTGADLSALDLRDVDFTDAWLESANLQGANVSGANFSRAVLAHAGLQGMVAMGSNFTHANLGRSRTSGAVFDQAQLAGAVLMHCQLAQTSLRRAGITGANLLETTWGSADWSGVEAAGNLFYKLDMKGLQASEANLAGATIVECDLSGIDLRGARLAGASFVACRLDGTRLTGAQLDGAVFDKHCSLAGADLSHASLRSANLGEVEMRGCLLIKAQLSGANFGAARLADCDARLAVAQGTLLRKAVLTRARLAGANFKDAMLQHADLRSADLRNANFFGADLSRAKLDGDVQFEGALLERVRTWPRLTPEQQARHAAAHPI